MKCRVDALEVIKISLVNGAVDGYVELNLKNDVLINLRVSQHLVPEKDRIVMFAEYRCDRLFCREDVPILDSVLDYIVDILNKWHVIKFESHTWEEEVCEE